MEEVKKTRNLTPEEKRAWILENCINEDGDIDLSNLDFSKFKGNVRIDNMKVKARFKHLREKIGTQEEMAEILGTAPSAIGMWENGERMPRYSTAKKIAKLFGISVNELYEMIYAEKQMNR